MRLEKHLHANCSEWNNYGDTEEEDVVDKMQAFVDGEYKSLEQLKAEWKAKEEKK